ncbi:sulfite exporter TauE/SafE family protein [Actinomyces culturomici]|uniref:sulfite exporter TauE/SafE family protein n=1 Tax=Actinomyces culturomici TaxID=1926276 RepID=UPI001C552347|nr:TSUP family transporter [Actinomyces culturomici]
MPFDPAALIDSIERIAVETVPTLGSLGVAPHLLVLLGAAFLAGAVDAVVGGGGLIQLPAVLLVPGIAPVTALATNKLASFAGTGTAAVAYSRRIGSDLRIAAPTALLAFLAASGGAGLASRIPKNSFTPLVIGALLVVLVLTIAKPQLFASKRSGLPIGALIARTVPFGGIVGLYDGLLGPGTGSFLLMAFIGAAQMDVLRATALTKIVNSATNLGALLFFGAHGAIDWPLGLAMAAANMAGGYTGARWATRLGARFIRRVLVIVVLALLVKLASQLVA